MVTQVSRDQFYSDPAFAAEDFLLFLGGKLVHLHISSGMSGHSFGGRTERKGKETGSYASSDTFSPAHPRQSCEAGVHEYSHFTDLEMEVSHEEIDLVKVTQRVISRGRIGLWSHGFKR